MLTIVRISKKKSKGISPDMVIPTVLTQASNLEEIIDFFDKKFVIINDTNPTLDLTPPLHFIFLILVVKV